MPKLKVDLIVDDKGSLVVKKFAGNTSTYMHSAAASVASVTKAMAGLAASFALYKVAGAIEHTALLTARYETLGIVIDQLGKNAGYSKKAVNDFAKALQKTGISMIESRQGIARLLQAHIDLAYATRLGRIAQDAAVIGNMNSSEAFNQMVYGLQSANVRVLRTIGLNVNFKNSYKRLAAQLHKTSLSLTEQEKAQARVNEIFKSGIGIFGAYKAAMATAAKQLKSSERYRQDLGVNFGAVFSPALLMTVKGFNAEVKSLSLEFKNLKRTGDMDAWAHGITAAVTALPPISRVVALGGALALTAKGYKLISAATMQAASSLTLYNAQYALTAELYSAGLLSRMDVFKGNFLGIAANAGVAETAVASLNLAVKGLFSGFVGWEFGSWLSDNFETARDAGVMFVDVTSRGIRQIEDGFQRLGLAAQAVNKWREGVSSTDISAWYSVQLDNISRHTAAWKKGHEKTIMSMLSSAASPQTQHDKSQVAAVNTRPAPGTTNPAAQTSKPEFYDMYYTAAGPAAPPTDLLLKQIKSYQDDMLEVTKKTNKNIAADTAATTVELSEFWRTAYGNMQNIGSAFWESMLQGNDNWLTDFRKMTLKMVDQWLSAKTMMGLFGDVSSTGKLGGLLGVGFSALGSLFGSGAVEGPHQALPSTWHAPMALPKAGGGDVSPYSMQRVNELGPELLSIGSHDYLMMGGRGGKVTSNNRIKNHGGHETNIYADMRGASVEAVQRLELMVNHLNANLENRAVSAVVNARQRGMTSA